MAAHDLRMTQARLERGLSYTCTDQGPQGTCAFHSTAKIILHNVCEVLVNLELSEEEKRLYHQCLSDYPIETAKDIGQYDKKCSEKGFVKIMFFYYIYHFVERNNIKRLDDPDISRLIDTFSERIAVVLPLDNPTFIQYRDQMLDRKREMNLMWKPITIGFVDTFLPKGISPKLHLKNMMDQVVEPILKLNLYVSMLLEGHSVVLANYADGKFAIKNSWGELITYSDLSLKVTLNSQTFDLLFLTLMLPMSTTFSYEHHKIPTYILPQHMDDLIAFIPEYERHYSTFRIRIRGGKTRKRSKRSKRSKRKKM